MSLFLILYVLAICASAAAIVYGIVRPERPRHAEAVVRPPRPGPATEKRSRRLAA